MFILFGLFFAQTSCARAQIEVGAEVLITSHLDELRGKKVGIVCNPSSLVGDTHLIDTLRARGIDISLLFAPEHGLRGNAEAGAEIKDGIDSKTGIPVVSLYGQKKKPSAADLLDLDLLLFDIQDVGVRCYTYASTMGAVMEACIENNKAIWILDRPNPLGGETVAGWVTEEDWISFVAPYPVAFLHGLTLGEYAQMLLGEGWIPAAEKSELLKVIPVEGLNRIMIWKDWTDHWVAPSPNLPTFASVRAYAGMVLLEGTNVSEGRGTAQPFQTFGAPWIQASDPNIQQLMDKYGIQGEPLSFIPESIPGKSNNPKYEGELCHGFLLTGFPEQVSAVFYFALDLLTYLESRYSMFETKRFLSNLAGTANIMSIIQQGDLDSFKVSSKNFMEKREAYLIYD